MKKYTIKEFAEGKKAVKIENKEQWNKLNKVHKLTPRYLGAVYYYDNNHTYTALDINHRANYYTNPENGYEVLEFSQLDFEDEFVEGKWYKVDSKELYYLKFERLENTGSYYKLHGETINNGNYSEKGFWANTLFENQMRKNGFLTDLSEIQQYLPLNHPDLIKKDTFVLPEFWHVVVTEENKEVLSRWRFDDQPSLNLDGYIGGIVGLLPKYPNSRNHNTSKDKDWNRSIEITFEEFKTHVLKESTMQKIKEGSQFKVSGESANTIYTFNRIEGDGVDVTWGTTHHVHYYLSTCLANIKDGSWILINKEKTMEKEIKEYKLKFAEYIKAANTITGTSTDYTKNGFIPDSVAYKKLKEAGVLDLWFEKVYAPEYKVGDWCFTNQFDSGTFKILKIEGDKIFNMPNGWVFLSKGIRLATPEEIKAAQIQLPTINGYSGSYENGIIKYGCAEFSKMFFEHLNSTNSHLGNRTIKSIKLSSDVEISIEEIKQIVEYINKK